MDVLESGTTAAPVIAARQARKTLRMQGIRKDLGDE